MNNNKKILISLAVIAAVAGTGAFIMTSNKSITPNTVPSVTDFQNQNSSVANAENASTANTNTVATNSTVSNTPATPTVNTNSSKTLNASIKFQVPENHTNSLSVSLTIDTDGYITDISFNQNSTNHESKDYANNFKTSFSKSSLVGQSLKSASISRTGGASLTTKAFNEALSSLASQI